MAFTHYEKDFGEIFSFNNLRETKGFEDNNYIKIVFFIYEQITTNKLD